MFLYPGDVVVDEEGFSAMHDVNAMGCDRGVDLKH